VKTELRTYLDQFYTDCDEKSEHLNDSDMSWAATALTFHLHKLFDERTDLATLERSVVLHRFVHPTKLTPLNSDFCSGVMKYVCGHMIRNYESRLENRIRGLFGGCGMGILFESVAFDTMYQNLKEGRSYSLQPVKGQKGTSSTLRCPVNRKVLIRTLSDISKLKSGDVGIPVVGNFPVADFIVGKNLLQMTVADSHPVKKERLADIRGALKTRNSGLPSLRLIFVTEAKTVDSFKGDSSAVTSSTSWVQQYVTAPDMTASSSSVLGKTRRSECSSRCSTSQKKKKKKAKTTKRGSGAKLATCSSVKGRNNENSN
jgi:hypothetical protein